VKANLTFGEIKMQTQQSFMDKIGQNHKKIVIINIILGILVCVSPSLLESEVSGLSYQYIIAGAMIITGGIYLLNFNKEKEEPLQQQDHEIIPTQKRQAASPEHHHEPRETRTPARPKYDSNEQLAQILKTFEAEKKPETRKNDLERLQEQIRQKKEEKKQEKDPNSDLFHISKVDTEHGK